MHHETRWQQGDRTPQATALEIALAEPSRDSAHLLVLLRERLAQAAAAGADARARAAGRRHRQARRAEQRAVSDPAERGRRPDAPDRAAAGAPRRRPGAASGGGRGPSSRAGEPAAGATRRAAGDVAAPRRQRRVAASPPARRRSSAAARRRRIRSGCRCAEPLAERRSRPLLDGRPLSCSRGRSGSRPAGGTPSLAERDYFIAEAADGALVWIYRARLPLSAASAKAAAGSCTVGVRLTEGASAALFADQREAAPAQRSLSQRLPLTPQKSM